MFTATSGKKIIVTIEEAIEWVKDELPPRWAPYSAGELDALADRTIATMKTKPEWEQVLAICDEEEAHRIILKVFRMRSQELLKKMSAEN